MELQSSREPSIECSVNDDRMDIEENDRLPKVIVKYRVVRMDIDGKSNRVY